MPTPLPSPAVDDVPPKEPSAFDPDRRVRWARIAAWGLIALLALVALTTTGMRLLVLPWPMAVALGLVLGFALALLAGGMLLIALAVNPPGGRRRRR